MYKYFVNAIDIVNNIMKKRVVEGSTVVDATIGNGHDTNLLASLVGNEGKVYGFDIQEDAINSTRIKLEKNNLDNRVRLIKDSHEYIQKYINEKVDFIIFNLGYLPGGHHSITTKSDSTIKAVEKSLELLNNNGILLIVVYPGHSSGKIEKEKIDDYLKLLNQKEFTVLKFDFINQINHPPILYGIEKKSN
ncbi:putative rRNA methylase [Gottschalkia purinilytica]|uniref:Putative rRNA methylase n=1 Tax=Gottschalkia purinilytica TaxID=1503 RepID=A0A0L0W7B4_GOTPU|nr:putative rRNA methylase [Gottschalkia purinilytica]